MKLQAALGSILVLAQVVAVISLPMTASNAVEDRQNINYVFTSITTVPSDASNAHSASGNQWHDDRSLSVSSGAFELSITDKARSDELFQRAATQALEGADDPESHQVPANMAFPPGPPTWKRTPPQPGPPTWKRDATNDHKKPGPPTWKREKESQGAGPPTWKRGSTEKQVVDSPEPVSVSDHLMVPGPPVWKA